MIRLRHISMWVSAAFMAATAVSCGNDGPYNDTVTSYDIVKLESQTALSATFTLQKPLSQDIVVYRSMPVIDTAAVRPGNRLLLAYVPVSGEPYVSGDITVRGYSPINNDTVVSGYIAKYPEWNRDAVYLQSAWLSGDCLNVHCRLTYDPEPRTMILLADSLSVDAEVAECYLVHTLKEPKDNFMRSYYVSFDVSALQRRPGCRGLRLHLNNSNLPVNSMDFDFTAPHQQ